METIDRLYSTTLQSTPLTHSRLKYLSNIAQTSEDYISRLGLALSLANPSVNQDLRPELLPSESCSPKFIQLIDGDTYKPILKLVGDGSACS